MKRFLYLFLTFLIVLGFNIVFADPAVKTSAKAAVVMDVSTGRVLFSENPELKLPMASTTKIMTTLIAVESGKLSDTVKVSKKAANTGGSSIYLREGETLTVEELLYAIMLRSGNDASTAVAEYLGGSVEGFAEIMNKKAVEIGAYNTHFTNPHGLDNPEHYTTAYDLALITSYALRNEKFAEIVKTKRKTISGPPDSEWGRSMLNKNKMLWQFDGGDGVKTGFTGNAGRCLVTSATRNGWQLVSVVLNSNPMWEDSASILNYAFSSYTMQKVVDSGQIYQQLKVISGKEPTVEIKPSNNLYMPLAQEEAKKLVFIPALKFNNKAPIYKGSKAGELKIYVENEYIGSVDLEYNKSVESKDPMHYFRRIFRSVAN